MLKVDLCRGKNVILQPAESELMKKLWEMKLNTDKIGEVLDGVKVQGKGYYDELMLLDMLVKIRQGECIRVQWRHYE